MPRKNHNQLIVIIIITLSLLSGAWSLPFQANKPITNNTPDDAEIKSVINSYFELRYITLNTLALNDFSNLLATSGEAESFKDSELGKLTIEIKNAKKKSPQIF